MEGVEIRLGGRVRFCGSLRNGCAKEGAAKKKNGRPSSGGGGLLVRREIQRYHEARE